MLEELNITNLGIVADTSLPFAPGLNVITGETGAGKSMILNGLGLLLGSRAKTSLISKGKPSLVIEGCWTLDEVPSFVEDTNATVDEGQLFVSRTVKADGKSRAVIGGRSVPASVLSEVSSQLVSIHGQSDQLKLKSNAKQLRILDRFAEGQKTLKSFQEYESAYKEWKSLSKKIAEYHSTAALKQREHQYHDELVSLVGSYGFRQGEDDELRKEIARLDSLGAVTEQMMTSSLLIAADDDSPDISSMLGTLVNHLNSASQLNEGLLELATQAENVNSQLQDISTDIASYLHSCSMDAEETMSALNAAQERLNLIFETAREYSQVSLNALLDSVSDSQKWLEENPPLGSVEELERLCAESESKMKSFAGELTAERKAAAKVFASKMNEVLTDLNMGSSVFIVQVSSSEFTATGADSIDFMLKAHKTADPQPISKTASGGELSRVMLALETVTASTGDIATFVFDEVDSGVGGETAVQIGKLLAKLSKTSQVIVVTHLPQVASFADNHLLIKKDSGEDSVITSVQQLNADQKRGEVARMLSGLNDSITGLAHADELIDYAESWKRL